MALLWLSACSVAVPSVRSDATPASSAAAQGVELCRIDSEVNDRPLLFGADQFSFESWKQVIGSVVIRHPQGIVVIDPAFGRDLKRDLWQAPLWFRLVFGRSDGRPALATQLAEVGIEPAEVRFAAITHGHWDHFGAVRDLPQAMVMISATELLHVRGLSGHLEYGTIPRQFDISPLRFAPYSFDGPARDGFESSHDLFGDGSIIALPLPGHTPGSAAYLVTGPAGKRWLFVGDAAWSLEAIKRSLGKQPFASMIVDLDRELAAKQVGFLHDFMEKRPEISVVPAHDLRAMESVPLCVK